MAKVPLSQAKRIIQEREARLATQESYVNNGPGGAYQGTFQRRYGNQLVNTGATQGRSFSAPGENGGEHVGTLGYSEDDPRGLSFIRLMKLNVFSTMRHWSPRDTVEYAQKIYKHDRLLLNTLKRGLEVQTPIEGGFGVSTPMYQEIIPLLRATARVRQCGARQIRMTKPMMELPRQNTAPTAGFAGEVDDLQATDLQMGQYVMRAKRMGAVLVTSKDLLMSSDVENEQFLRDQLILTLALKEDYAFLLGDGSGESWVGILNYPGVQLLSMGTNGGALGINTPSLIERKAKEKFSRNVKPGYLMTARSEEEFREMTFASNAKWVFRDNMDAQGKLGNVPYYVEEQIADTATQGTAVGTCSYLFYGDWNEAIIGLHRDIQFDVATQANYKDSNNAWQSLWTKGQIGIMVDYWQDFALAQPGVFVVATGVL